MVRALSAASLTVLHSYIDSSVESITQRMLDAFNASSQSSILSALDAIFRVTMDEERTLYNRYSSSSLNSQISMPVSVTTNGPDGPSQHLQTLTTIGMVGAAEPPTFQAPDKAVNMYSDVGDYMDALFSP